MMRIRSRSPLSITPSYERHSRFGDGYFHLYPRTDLRDDGIQAGFESVFTGLDALPLVGGADDELGDGVGVVEPGESAEVEELLSAPPEPLESDDVDPFESGPAEPVLGESALESDPASPNLVDLAPDRLSVL